MPEESANDMGWDSLALSYEAPDGADGQEVELPMRLLVLGGFSGPAPMRDLSEPAPVRVTTATLDEVMREHRIALTVELENRLAPGQPPLGPLRVTIQCLDDFGPDRLIERIPELRAVSRLASWIREVKAANEVGAVPPPAPDGLPDRVLEDFGLTGGEADPDRLDYALAELSARLARQLDELLHHADFQAVEAAWRGVRLLADVADRQPGCGVDILDMDKAALRRDLEETADLEDTLFFSTLYSHEFGQYGGQPYTAVIADYAFGPEDTDVAMLRRVARICSVAHAPFLASAAPDLFGVVSAEDLPSTSSLNDLHRGARFAKWRGFSDEGESRYVGLTFPRALLRAAYDYRRGDVRAFAYRENITSRSTDCLWGNAAFAFGLCLLRSFGRYRVCVDITGSDGGRVRGLPAATLRRDGQTVYPVEVLVPERKEAELADLGFIPLVPSRADEDMVFYSANSVRWGGIEDRGRSTDPVTVGAVLAARLPYMFLVSRIAHYLKVVQRDNIGAQISRAELQSNLNTWLRRYVSDVENPSASIRATRPLRRASLQIEESDDGGPWFGMALQVTPHTKYLGTDFSLSLEGRLGRT